MVAAILALGSAGALALRRRDGRLTGPGHTASRQRPLTGTELGQPLGSRATLLQFSSSFCAPCRAAQGQDGGHHDRSGKHACLQRN